MDIFEYLIAVPAIILGLGITHLVAFFGNLIVLRKNILFDGIQVSWVLVTFLLHIQFFYVLWALRGLDSWHVEQILLVILFVCMVAISARVVAPDFSVSKIASLTDYFSEIRRPFFILLSFVSIGQAFARTLGFGDSLLELETLCEISWSLVALSGIFVASRKVDSVLLLLWFSTSAVWFYLAKVIV